MFEAQQAFVFGTGITKGWPTLTPVALACFLWPITAQCEMVELAPTADTFLSEHWPTSNFGGARFANAGTTQNFTRNRALFRFDLPTHIPPGSRVDSVQLILEATREPIDGYNFADFSLHRMLVDWGEGDTVAPPGTNPGNGAPAAPGEANWTHRFAGTEATWGQPGGMAGVDFDIQPSATTTVYGVGDSPYIFGSAAGLVSDVQLWVDEPNRNFGWLLMTRSEGLDFTARRFGSREDPVNAPRLVVAYTIIPEPSTCAMLALGAVLLLNRRRAGPKNSRQT